MERQNLLEWCKLKTNNSKLKDEGDFKMVIDILIGIFENLGVTSESIDGLSQSFSADAYRDIIKLLSPYRKAKFI